MTTTEQIKLQKSQSHRTLQVFSDFIVDSNWGVNRMGRNPTARFRSSPTPTTTTRRRSQLSSQSHRTLQVFSDGPIVEINRLDGEVAIPPHASGLLRPSTRTGSTARATTCRNPTARFRSSPTHPLLLRWRPQHLVVAIPPHASGLLRLVCELSDEELELSRNPTARFRSSPTRTREGIDVSGLKSQSHRTLQVFSDNGCAAQVRSLQKDGRNPTARFRSSPTRTRMSQPIHYWRSRNPTARFRSSPTLMVMLCLGFTANGRNPTARFRSSPTQVLGASHNTNVQKSQSHRTLQVFSDPFGRGSAGGQDAWSQSHRTLQVFSDSHHEMY